MSDNLKQRIEQQKTGKLPWTSNATVTDWYLMHAYKIKPLGMVQGCIDYQLGFGIGFVSLYQAMRTQYTNFKSTNVIDLSEYADVIQKAADAALVRLQHEAKLYGAHAVVNVEFTYELTRDDGHYIQCTAMGTAVQLGDKPQPDNPLVCGCSMTEFAKLLQAGTMPTGMVIGAGVTYTQSDFGISRFGRNFQNREMNAFTQALYQVKNNALQHLQQATKQLDGDGVIKCNSHFRKYEINQQNNNKDNDYFKEYILIYLTTGTVVNQVSNQVEPIKTQLELN